MARNLKRSAAGLLLTSAVSCALLSSLAAASEKVFLATPQLCSVAGGQVFISIEKEKYLMETVGSINGTNIQFCGKGWFGTRQCVPLTLYNFKVICRGGVVTAPALYMALFGNDQETQKQGFVLAGDQITYIDPGTVLYQTNPRRVGFPRGFAPFPATQMANLFKRLDWDDAKGRPVTDKTLTQSQETRIRQLFATKDGQVQPLGVVHVQTTLPPPPPKPPPHRTSKSSVDPVIFHFP